MLQTLGVLTVGSNPHKFRLVTHYQITPQSVSKVRRVEWHPACSLEYRMLAVTDTDALSNRSLLLSQKHVNVPLSVQAQSCEPHRCQPLNLAVLMVYLAISSAVVA